MTHDSAMLIGALFFVEKVFKCLDNAVKLCYTPQKGGDLLLTVCIISTATLVDWIAVVLNCLLLTVTCVSAYYAFRAYNHQKERSKKEAACELAKYYAANVIDKYADITGVFDAAGITEVVKKALPLRDIKEFDRFELEKFLSEAKMTIEDFGKLLDEIDPKAIFSARVSRVKSEEDRIRAFQSYAKRSEDGEVEIVNSIFLRVDFDCEISSLLNELEWFSMSCIYGLADEELLYQSLHQTFISTVWMLYFFISKENINNEDKLYTNTCALFLKWRDRLIALSDHKEAEKEEHMRRAEAVKAPLYEGSKLK